jgi:hypothetical protein
MKAKSGGGPTMSKNVSPPIRTGSASKGSSAAAAGQLGTSTAFRPDRVESGPAYHSGVPLGNQKALDVQGGGPGKGRQVFRSGSQSLHGATAPGEAQRDARGLDTKGRGRDVV